jgi:hypothetical protein
MTGAYLTAVCGENVFRTSAYLFSEEWKLEYCVNDIMNSLPWIIIHSVIMYLFVVVWTYIIVDKLYIRTNF